MDRRALLAAAGLIALVGCTRNTGRGPNEQIPARPDDYAILLDDMATGDDPEQCRGAVCLLGPDGTVRGIEQFRPIDNARLINHNGAAAWMTNDSARHWGPTLRSWSDVPYAGGAIDNLIEAGNGVLAAINIGSKDGTGYSSGLMLFNQDTMEAWDHNGKLTAGVGATDALVVGIAAPGLADEQRQLTILTQGAPRAEFGPQIGGSFVWGERMVQAGGYTYILTASAMTGQSGHIWQIDPEQQSVKSIDLVGGAEDVAEWYAGNGPSELTAIDDMLYWQSNNQLWSADPTTGQTRRIRKLDGYGWFLEPSGLIFAEHTNHRLTVTRYDPVDGSRVAGFTTDELPLHRWMGPKGAVLLAT